MPKPSPKRNACPVCGGPAGTADAPFCGQGCRDRDLLQWLGDGYRLPGRMVEDDERESDRDGLDSTREPLL